MAKFLPSPKPTETIWGEPIQADQVLPGIWLVTTPSHGGLVLSDQRQEEMPEALKLDERFYEEDCDWSLVYVAFETEFDASDKSCTPGFLQLAHDTAKCWHPDRMTKHTGEAVPENVSHVLKTRAAYQAAIGEYCTTSAWGDWADWVPEGKVGVVAKKLLSVSHLGWPQYETGTEICALVDKVAYENRGEVTALSRIDHEVIDMPADIRPKRIA